MRDARRCRVRSCVRLQMSYGSHLYKACPERNSKCRGCREPPRSDNLRRRHCVSLCFKGQALTSPHRDMTYNPLTAVGMAPHDTPPISEGCDPHSRWWEACLSPAFDCGGSSRDSHTETRPFRWRLVKAVSAKGGVIGGLL